ncbi:MAG: CBS domain-containing protein [Thermoplasmata archaeon]|nr:CBS domain-containing protein [Thermoplasmata archaeon]
MAASWPTAREIMTARPTTLPTDAPLSQALGLMQAKSIHEVLVLRKKALAGMITFESIARRTNLPLGTKVEHLLVLPPIVAPTTTFPEIAEQLLASGLRAAPVVGPRGEVLGVVSRSDLVKRFAGFPSISAHKVEEISSPVGLLIREDEPCGTLFQQIRLLEEHPLPVVDKKGRLVGAVGVSDLGRVLMKPDSGGKRDAENRRTAPALKVGSIMHSPALTVPKGTTAGAAAALMSREKVSSVFVVENGKPTGVVSQTDLLGLAVGGDTVPSGEVSDVYVQIHGLRGSGDPEILTEIDRVVAKGLRHISRHAKPILLSLHVTPQGNHRGGDATVHARLHTDRGIFYASQTGWNFFAGISDLMDELEEQVRRVRDESGANKRRSRKGFPVDDSPGDPELEARLRAVRGDDED